MIHVHSHGILLSITEKMKKNVIIARTVQHVNEEANATWSVRVILCENPQLVPSVLLQVLYLLTQTIFLRTSSNRQQLSITAL
jgi:hypothetical protein